MAYDADDNQGELDLMNLKEFAWDSVIIDDGDALQKVIGMLPTEDEQDLYTEYQIKE